MAKKVSTGAETLYNGSTIAEAVAAVTSAVNGGATEITGESIGAVPSALQTVGLQVNGILVSPLSIRTTVITTESGDEYVTTSVKAMTADGHTVRPTVAIAALQTAVAAGATSIAFTVGSYPSKKTGLPVFISVEPTFKTAAGQTI